MNIYTRTGDGGMTSVIGGRVAKDDRQVEAYGTIDELNCFVGQAISLLDGERFHDLREHLTEIQNELFDCGSDLAFARPEGKEFKVRADMVTRLEEWIDRYDAENPDITRFILPGGTGAASVLHVCRTVCRRAERRVVTLAAGQPINEEVRKYLNRLSDLFFVVARTANARTGVADIEYIRSAEVFRKKS
ncbi:ATP:cob(I)alamin adenosyltransferase [Paenibacillus swuensis]|uniref:Corrinoid adenosyltransferase n=1 Tax=Paenibacillus swuensis TaxID=1178515 RepID=A0A172TP57_9BACL|nr:cob(I)yrinic acid a,c-diamide adenosyltransferase [Paenibacillus swuensis]ANE48597.1 ATP:cob(I)alamin adenosyltransferase [Paenibacillus swuensis]